MAIDPTYMPGGDPSSMPRPKGPGPGDPTPNPKAEGARLSPPSGTRGTATGAADHGPEKSVRAFESGSKSERPSTPGEPNTAGTSRAVSKVKR